LHKELETRVTARDVFKVVSDFPEEHSIKWKNMCCVYRESPCHAGLQVWISSFNKTVAPNAIGTNFVIYRQMLAAKTSLSGFKRIMSLVIQAVNFTKSSALSSRIVTKLCFQVSTTVKT
jgi:hypothetical protein